MTRQDIHPAVEAIKFELESKTSIKLDSKFNFSNKNELIAYLKGHGFEYTEDVNNLVFSKITVGIWAQLSVSPLIFDELGMLISESQYNELEMPISLINCVSRQQLLQSLKIK